MLTRNVPLPGPRYWTAISLASVFGANLGDFVSHVLHLGHVRGLPPLALIFLVILLGERRAKGGGEAWYWLAIVTLRTAATNLADLATHDLKLAAQWVLSGLTALLVGLLLLRRGDRDVRAVPRTDLAYWAAMLVAGTLGTALGDSLADELGLGVGPASLILGVILAALLGLRSLPAFVGLGSYWATIVAIRTTGTTVGDLLGDTLGLTTSTATSLLVFVVILVLWKPVRQPAAEPARFVGAGR